MARLKSEDRRNAILMAAIDIFAEKGLSAPTLAISAKAGVAEGTIYTYFDSKDGLINVLYQEIKRGMADAMMTDFPRRSGIQERLRHVWNGYVNWGIANPQQHKVMKLIWVWGGLTPESKIAGSAPFTELERMAVDAVSNSALQDLPPEFFAYGLQALAEMTMDFIRQDPNKAEESREYGFKMLWSAVSKRR
jgi:AcrR family transcriptional regulator